MVLEVNTLPGLTPMSLLPKIARARGLAFEELVERILAQATLDEVDVAPASPAREREAAARNVG